MTRQPLLHTLFVGLLFGFCLTLAGCASTVVVNNQDPTEQRMKAVATAYLRATQKLKRGPKNLDELKPFLQELGEPEELLRSPEDGQEFVILWGVTSGTFPPMREKQFPVLLYEKEGKNGKRLVYCLPTLLVEMSPEELKNAYFPPGHKPPEL
jgi:hypothetical protein